MSQEKDCYLVVNGHENDFRVLFHAKLSQAMITILQIEVEAYRTHIRALERGHAPDSCYTTPELKERLALAGHTLFYEKVMEVPSQNVYWPIDLLLIVDGVPLGDIHDPPAVRCMEESDMEKIKATPSFDWSFFQDKYDGEKYTLGFGVLPITKMIANGSK